MITHAKITSLQTYVEGCEIEFFFAVFVFRGVGQLFSFRCKHPVSHCVGNPCLTQVDIFPKIK